MNYSDNSLTQNLIKSTVIACCGDNALISYNLCHFVDGSHNVYRRQCEIVNINHHDY